MNFKEKKKYSLKIKILLEISTILIVLLLTIFIFKFKNYETIDSSYDKNNIYNDYIYKIRYDLGSESYIYLFPDNVIKTVDIQEIYEIVPDCNCLRATGEYSYNEEIINFSEETKKKVISIFDELHQKSGKKEFNADNMNLTEYQQRILLATILNFEDQITIEKNISYETINEEFVFKNNDYKIKNSKNVLNNLTENESVNKIANYLNTLVNNDFDVISNESKEIIKNEDIEKNTGVTLKLELIYTGVYNLSFIYTMEGKLGEKSVSKIKGFTFDYDGDINEFNMNGWKEKYYNEFLEKFMKTKLYHNYKDDLSNDWKSVLYDNMYLPGNWYLADGKLKFLIPAYLLGFDESIVKTIKVDIKFDGDI